MPQMYENPTFPFYLLKNWPRNRAQIVDLAMRIPEKNNSSVRQNLNDVVSKQGCDFHLFMKIQLFPFIFKRTGAETMPRL